MTKFRDYFRGRRVARHVRQHGSNYNFHGLQIRVPEHVDIALANALLKSKYETEEAGFVDAYLPKDRSVVELGGSLGVVSALIGDRLDLDVNHLIVEANPDLAEICLENASARGHRRATEVTSAAVSYEGDDEVSFTVGQNQHVSRLTNTSGQTNSGHKVTVPAVTLRDLHEKLGNPELYSLVCDIEGAETALVANDAEVLSKAGLIILETHPQFYEGGLGEAEGLCADIEALGFNIIDRAGCVFAFRNN